MAVPFAMPLIRGDEVLVASDQACSASWSVGMSLVRRKGELLVGGGSRGFWCWWWMGPLNKAPLLLGFWYCYFVCCHFHSLNPPDATPMVCFFSAPTRSWCSSARSAVWGDGDCGGGDGVRSPLWAGVFYNVYVLCGVPSAQVECLCLWCSPTMDRVVRGTWRIDWVGSSRFTGLCSDLTHSVQALLPASRAVLIWPHQECGSEASGCGSHSFRSSRDTANLQHLTSLGLSVKIGRSIVARPCVVK